MKCTCVLVVVVLVAMATKMAEACCLPDQAKADVFYTVNTTTIASKESTAISGMAAIAWDFTTQKFAVKFGPIMMKLGVMEIPVITRIDLLLDVAAGETTGYIDSMVLNGCLSWKVQGHLTDKYQCLDNYPDLVKVKSSSEMSIYHMVDAKDQVALALDANCVPTRFQALTGLDSKKEIDDIKLEFDNIELQVVDDDFLAPCDNPKAMPGTPLQVPEIEKVGEVLSAGMKQVGEAVMRRR